jgi:hypothetical protein
MQSRDRVDATDHSAIARGERGSQRQRMLAVWGLTYTVLGVAGLYGARRVQDPWHVWLNVVGFLLTVAGAWCLLWCFGVVTILGLDRIDDTRPIERTILVLSAMLGCLAFYLAWRT